MLVNLGKEFQTMLAFVIALIAILGIVCVGRSKDSKWGDSGDAYKVKIAVIAACGVVFGVLCYLAGSGTRYHIGNMSDSSYLRIYVFDSLMGRGYLCGGTFEPFIVYPKRKVEDKKTQSE